MWNLACKACKRYTEMPEHTIVKCLNQYESTMQNYRTLTENNVFERDTKMVEITMNLICRKNEGCYNR